MTTATPEELTRAMTSKQAILAGLSERAEQLSNQLETTLRQIDELNSEINAIHELQTESSNDPETQDPPATPTPHFPRDLEPVNHPEDQ